MYTLKHGDVCERGQVRTHRPYSHWLGRKQDCGTPCVLNSCQYKDPTLLRCMHSTAAGTYMGSATMDSWW